MLPGAIEVRTYVGPAIEPHLSAIARLRIEVFRDFPYLYDGTLAYEERYLRSYLASPRSVAILAFDGAETIGASTGMPLVEESQEFRAPFAGGAIPLGAVFYCAESVLNAAYRGRSVYRRFFEGRERHARELGGFTTSAFCAVARPEAHALRPRGYRPLDPVWKRFGYVEHPELTASFRWKDVDCSLETEKTMVFWLKALGS